MKVSHAAALCVAFAGALSIMPVTAVAQAAKAAPATGNTVMTCLTETGRDISVAYSPSKKSMELKVSSSASKAKLDIFSKLEAIYISDPLYFLDIYSFEDEGVKYRLIDADSDDGSLRPIMAVRAPGLDWVEYRCDSVNKNDAFKMPSTMPTPFKDMDSFIKKYGEEWRH